MKVKLTPVEIFEEYRAGNNYKRSIGTKGIVDQTKINERFYVGDQWYGAKMKNDRPLVRHNIIKRIGEYKTAIVGAAPISVRYSAEGIPNTVNFNEKNESIRDAIVGGNIPSFEDNDEINSVMNALSDYFDVTAERVKFGDIKEKALKNAYVSGTGIIYTYWDDDVNTGLYADCNKTVPIKGDIMCEVLDVENVIFGDPNTDDIQKQPYILIAQRKSVDEIKREAIINKRPGYEIELIKGDKDYTHGQWAEGEPANSNRAVVITKIFKEYNPDNKGYKIKAIRVCEKAIIRNVWDLKLSRYPIAKMSWEARKSSIYGDSEVTYLIPNQIAINRSLTAQVWSMIVMGMPMIVKDNDVIDGPVTNIPGQIIDVNRGGQGVSGAIEYISPPYFGGQFDNMIHSLINNTLSQAGANDAALGNMKPENMSAIVAVREAATMPMQTVQNRFYALCEDVARIWADFWINKYGNRKLKIEDSRGTWYLPFDAKKYKDFIVSVKVDVGASTIWGEAQVIATLDNLLSNGVITPMQYFERLPKGLVPDVGGLQRDLVLQSEREEEITHFTQEDIINELTDEQRELLFSLPEEVRTQMINNSMEAGKA